MAQATAAAPAAARRDNLALYFQEVLTAIVRLRANRQAVSDAESFRHHMREALKIAAQEAIRRGGYNGDDVKLATFAMVAFLDESILNSRNPLFADWPRKPLQEELFNVHMAGEHFFQHLEQLLTRGDSAELADLLEVYYLCLLLGFGGRYSVGGRGELKAVMDATGEKIRRIRGRSGDFSPAWQLPPETAKVIKDPWARRLLVAAVASLVLAVVLFAGFKLSLSSGVSEVRAVAAQGRS
jgi:type VI secretion system protein ImpK